MNHVRISLAGAWGLVVVLASHAIAAPPLIYEGTLTTGGLAPAPWPALRFSVVSADDLVLWTTEVDADGPIQFDERTGDFTAYIDFPHDAPPTVLDADAERRLQIEVCTPRVEPDGCEWLVLGTDTMGAVPFARALPRLARIGGGMMYVANIGSVPGTPDGEDTTVRDFEIAPLDQHARFVIEVLGSHDGQEAWLATRHILITERIGAGRIIASRRERSCYDQGGAGDQEHCASWGVSSDIGDFDDDGIVELRIANDHEPAVEGIVVMVRGVGEVLDFGR